MFFFLAWDLLFGDDFFGVVDFFREVLVIGNHFKVDEGVATDTADDVFGVSFGEGSSTSGALFHYFIYC